MMERVELRAPAKVNLRLRVLAREASGFHSLETVFCAVSLFDIVRVSRAEPGIQLIVTGDVDTGPPERNLATLAAERFFAGLGTEPAVRIELVKRIPSAAGLGGGSSDAAATLRALNRLYGESLSRETLLEWGAGLGSDVPFFLCGSPLAIAWSRGERLLALPPLPPRPVLIVRPGMPMATPDLFTRLATIRGEDPRVEGWSTALADLQDWQRLASMATNDFHLAAFEMLPVLRQVQRSLLEAGAEIALLSGSGSALFGLFPDETTRLRAENAVAPLGFTTLRAETLAEWPQPEVSSGIA
jgi:4-diphosphocytidyl-2-C-methyl-D-erythritol kinase